MVLSYLKDKRGASEYVSLVVGIAISVVIGALVYSGVLYAMNGSVANGLKTSFDTSEKPKQNISIGANDENKNSLIIEDFDFNSNNTPDVSDYFKNTNSIKLVNKGAELNYSAEYTVDLLNKTLVDWNGPKRWNVSTTDVAYGSNGITLISGENVSINVESNSYDHYDGLKFKLTNSGTSTSVDVNIAGKSKTIMLNNGINDIDIAFNSVNLEQSSESNLTITLNGSVNDTIIGNVVAYKNKASASVNVLYHLNSDMAISRLKSALSQDNINEYKMVCYLEVPIESQKNVISSLTFNSKSIVKTINGQYEGNNLTFDLSEISEDSDFISFVENLESFEISVIDKVDSISNERISYYIDNIVAEPK